jgi:hypothetical protein
MFSIFSRLGAARIVFIHRYFLTQSLPSPTSRQSQVMVEKGLQVVDPTSSRDQVMAELTPLHCERLEARMVKVQANDSIFDMLF